MKTYTWALIIATVVLAAVMLLTHALSWASLGNNLLVGLICALLTATVFTWVLEQDRKRMDGLWASEVIFLQMVDVKLTIEQGARWLLSDDPPGIESDERWMPIADDLRKRRDRLGSLLTRETTSAVIGLEETLRRLDFVTARGDESRKAYAKDLLSLWRTYQYIMEKMLPPGDELRRDLLTYPNELRQLKDKYNLTEVGIDRDEDAAMRAALKR